MLALRTTLTLLSLTALSILGLDPSVEPLAAPQDELAEREWNQARGNADGTGTCGYEPIREVPFEIWRKSWDGVLCEPVAWNGVLYIVVEKKGKKELHAYRIADGEQLGKSRLDKKATSFRLAVQDGTVVVVTPDEIALGVTSSPVPEAPDPNFDVPPTWEGKKRNDWKTVLGGIQKKMEYNKAADEYNAALAAKSDISIKDGKIEMCVKGYKLTMSSSEHKFGSSLVVKK